MTERLLVSSRIAHCGCIGEEWIVSHLDVRIHFENEAGEQFADCFVAGDGWDVENRHPGPPEIARESAFSFIESWPAEGDPQ